MPPRYSPFSETASNVVAVPRSITMQGPPYLWNPATEFTIRSAPTSCGCSYRMGMPVFIPGCTMNGSHLKYLTAISRIDGRSGGTTQLIAIPAMRLSENPPSASRFLINTPCSSEVRSLTVVSRQLPITVGPSIRPTNVFVLPISIASNTLVSFCDMTEYLLRKKSACLQAAARSARRTDPDHV